MTQLERADLHAAIEIRYPDNTTEEITPLRLREGLHELVDSVFVTATDTGAVPNVPLYQAGTTYVVGATVRFTPGSGLEAFYYALKAGKLPAPVAVADPNWKIVPGPVPVTQLGQTITLAQARNINGDTVVLGRDYAIELPLPSASGHAQVLSVAGIAENWFSSEGYLVSNNVRTRIHAIDYQAGTWSRSATGGTQYTQLISLPSLRVVYMYPPMPFSIDEVKLRDNTRFVEFQVNQLVNGVWVPGSVQTYAGANLTLAAIPQAQYDAGVEVALHAAATDDRFTTAAVVSLSGSWLSGGWERWVTDRANFRSSNTGRSVEPAAGLPMNMTAPAVNQGFYFENPALAKCAVCFWMRRDTLPDPNEYWFASSRPANNALVAGYTSSATFYVENQTYSSGNQGMAPGQWCRVWVLFYNLNAGQITLFASNPGVNPTQGPFRFQFADVYFMNDHPTSLQLADREFAPVDAIGYWNINPTTDTTQPVADLSGNNRTGAFFGF